MVETQLFNHNNITGKMNFVLSSSPSSTSPSSSNSPYASTSPSSSSSHLPSSPTNQTVQRNNTNIRVRQRHLNKSTIITINSKSPSSPSSSLSSPSSSSTSSSPLSTRNLSSASPQLKPLHRLIPKVSSQLNITSDQLYQPFTNLHNNKIVRSQSNCSSHLSNDYFSDSINSHWNTNEQINHSHSHHRSHLPHSQSQPQQNLNPPNSYPVSSFQMGLNNNLYIPYPANHHCSSSSASSPASLVIDRQVVSLTNDCPSMLPACPKSKCPCLVPTTVASTSLTSNFIQISSQPDSSLSPSSSSATITNNLCPVNIANCTNECSSQCALPVTVDSNNSSSNHTATNIANNNNSNTSNKASKPRRRVATMAQRRAANIRERRRMFHLNTAFDRLRKKVPTFAYEKRLSRIETLRLAVMYITFMTEILKGTSAKDCSPRIPLHPSTGSFQNHQIIDTSSSSSTSSDSSTSSSPIWESIHIHT